MEIERVRDLAALRDFHAVESAAHDHDFVALPADPIEEKVPLLETPETAGERTHLYVGRSEGVPVGVLSVRFPTLDNLATAGVEVQVHPDHRHRGHGRALLGAACATVRAEGRRRIFAEAPWAPDGTEGPAFPLLREVGARPVLEDFRRVLDLDRHPVGLPLPAPAGYAVVQWLDRAPDEVVDGVAYLMGRMTLDAPMGEMDYEPEKWDAARYRDKEVAAQARNRTRVASAVVRVDTGQVAGVTDIGVSRSRADVAYQWDTIVDPEHRGHRLGMVLKSHNHRLLTEQRPGVRFVNTWNAASNSFMVAVNDALGFEPAERWTEWQLDL